MAIKYVVTHRTDPNNVGDIASNPLQYFLQPDEYQVVDIDYITTIKYINSIRKCALRRDTCLGRGLFEYNLLVNQKNCTNVFCSKKDTYHVCNCK